CGRDAAAGPEMLTVSQSAGGGGGVLLCSWRAGPGPSEPGPVAAWARVTAGPSASITLLGSCSALTHTAHSPGPPPLALPSWSLSPGLWPGDECYILAVSTGATWGLGPQPGGCTRPVAEDPSVSSSFDLPLNPAPSPSLHPVPLRPGDTAPADWGPVRQWCA
ncbi:unnamed protein product, partial [Gadus morhua 'NCC']